MINRDNRAYAAQRCAEAFGEHVMKERVSRSYDFRRSDGCSTYAFAITWAPGTLALSGDVGEMALTHYQAMPTFEAMLDWVDRADEDYLLGKSNKRQEFDGERTAHSIIRMANDQVNISGWRKHEWHDWMRDKPKREEFFADDDGAAEADFADEVAYWQTGKPKFEFTKRQIRPYDRGYRYSLTIDTELVPPDGWELWHALREEFAGWLNPEDIFVAKHRACIRDEVESYFSSSDCSAEQAANKCAELGLDDYYGDYGWNFQSLIQIGAIKHGVSMIRQAAIADAEAA